MGTALNLRMSRLRWLCGLALVSLVATAAHAQLPASEEAVEAAYLHKFPGFVEWPAGAFKSSTSPIVIGLVGAPEVLEELTKLARGRLVLNRPVEVRAVDPKELSPDVHVLFIGKNAAMTGTKALIAEARGSHMLIVTDMPDGLRAGAVIEFVRVDGRLRFEASLRAAALAGVKLSSKLLSVASKVVEDAP
jgi:hypothetical protein